MGAGWLFTNCWIVYRRGELSKYKHFLSVKILNTWMQLKLCDIDKLVCIVCF